MRRVARAAARVASPAAHRMFLPDPDKLAWCVIDGTAIFLDIRGDRYFRLPVEPNRRFLDAHDFPGPGVPVQPAGMPLPSSWQLPARQCPAIHEGPFRLGDVARALWMQRRVERQLSAGSFGAVLNDALRVTSTRLCGAAVQDELPKREIRAFEQAKLLRSAADRCLPRSIALGLCLARRQFRAHIVLAVKLAPFAAHCWLQTGDEVLNDEVEEVLRYSPILVV